MSEMFNSLYDDIFLKDTNITPDKDKIDIVTKKYIESKANYLDKKFFLKLRREYLKIKSISDYQMLQNKLYGNKSKTEKVLFEIARIKNNNNLDVVILGQITDVEKLLSVYNGDVTDELYNKIINLIISIEISLNMRVGLFCELCCLFENEIVRIDEELVVFDSIYVKRK